MDFSDLLMFIVGGLIFPYVKDIWKYQRNLKKKKANTKAVKNKQEYNTTIMNAKYRIWVREILFKIYQNDLETSTQDTNGLKCISLFGKKYPEICFPYIGDCCKKVKDLNKILHKKSPMHEIALESLKPENISSQDYKTILKLRKEFWEIEKENMEFPDNLNFCLNSLKINENNTVSDDISLSANYCTFKDAVNSIRIMEYELYKYFRKIYPRDSFNSKTEEDIKNDVKSLSLYSIWKNLPIRRAIHGGVNLKTDNITPNISLKDIFMNGSTRLSNLSMQVFIAYKKEETDDDYYMFIIKRSNKHIVAAQGFYQFIPCGSLETGYAHNDERVTLNLNIKKNYDIPATISREYLEEIFGEKEYFDTKSLTNNARVSPEEDQRWKFIEDKINKGECKLKFLGLTYSLDTLGFELSFALVLEDSEFYKMFRSQIQGNFEALNQAVLTDEISRVKNLPEIFNTCTVEGGSVGIFYLLKHDKDLQNILR